MSDPTPFRPNWASHPGNTIRDLIEHQGWSWEEAEKHTGLFQGYLKQLCAGKNRITEAAAERLGEKGHGSEQFWLNRQAQYDETLARLRGQVKPEPEEDTPDYLVIFEDPGKGMATFNDGEEAAAYHAKARDSWNCHLYRRVMS